MNQAMRRPLRPCHLVLLVPLLLASAPAVAQTDTSTQGLVAAGFRVHFPAPAVAGTWAPFTVTPLGSDGKALQGFVGVVTVTASGTGAKVTPGSHTYLLLDKGVGHFKVLWPSSGRYQLTVTQPLGPPHEELVSVLPAEPESLELMTASTAITAGQPFEVWVFTKDGSGNRVPYGGPLQFTSSDFKAELPTGTGPQPFRVTLKTAWGQTVTATGPNFVMCRLNMTVRPASVDQVLLSTPATQAVDACTSAVVELQAADEFGNRVPEARNVRLCGSPGAALQATGNTFSNNPSSNGGCIEGLLSSAGGARVSWSNGAPGTITFTVTSLRSIPLPLTWQRGGFSPEHSVLSFPEATETPPRLRTFTDELRVQFDLRNACGEAVEPPAGQSFSFEGMSPLALTELPELSQVGRRAAVARLPKCPDTGNAPLKLGPALNGEFIQSQTGELPKEVRPDCQPPDVQLEVEAKDAGAMPGALVEFEVTLSNTGDKVIPEGLLWLETQALTGREARLDGERLGAIDDKLTLPALEPGGTRTVKLQGQAAVQMDVPVRLTARYTTLQGVALTEEKQLSLKWDDLAVDVGCGCQTGSLPSQFLPWLALLAAASRSRSRLRRLSRGERNDR